MSASSNKRPALPTNKSPEPAFICTICWTPKFLPSIPKLLGTDARIACSSCWRAVLDLSICWVCGDYIEGGSGVVSLEWCFWHLQCFGCLTCGTRMCLPDTAESGNAVQLDSIPMCEACVTGAEEEDDSQLLECGLQIVSRFDGGLSRDRLKMLSEIGGQIDGGDDFRIRGGRVLITTADRRQSRDRIAVR